MYKVEFKIERITKTNVGGKPSFVVVIQRDSINMRRWVVIISGN